MPPPTKSQPSRPLSSAFRSLAEGAAGASQAPSTSQFSSHAQRIIQIRQESGESIAGRKRSRVPTVTTPLVVDTSDDELPQISFPTPRGSLSRNRSPNLTGSSTSLNEPPSSRRRHDSSSEAPAFSTARAIAQSPTVRTLARRDSGSSARGRSLSRDSRSSQVRESRDDDDASFRFIDETLLNDSQQYPADHHPPCHFPVIPRRQRLNC